MLARRFAGCFVDEPVVYAKHVIRAADQPGGFTPPRERILEPHTGGPQYRGKIAVLMGPKNLSSCEAFLLMMKQVPQCKLIGEKSYGSSGNPQPIGLPNGVTVYLPSWRAMRPDGTCFEGEGIAPDIRVRAPAKVLEEQDPVLEAALEYLRADEPAEE
jgi:C-terminal processing protease CtpA/Prc